MKNAEGFFPSLPARSSRGESWREGKLIKNGLLSPTLSSFFGGEGEGKRWCAPSKLLAEQKWSVTRSLRCGGMGLEFSSAPHRFHVLRLAESRAELDPTRLRPKPHFDFSQPCRERPEKPKRKKP